MFDNIKSKMKREKEEKLQKVTNDNFGVAEMGGNIYITHYGEAVKKVTSESMETAISMLDEMRKANYEWSLVRGER